MSWEYLSDKSKGVRTAIFEVDDLKIVITRHIHYPPNMWLMSCSPWFDYVELKSKNINLAKLEALDIVTNKLHGILKKLIEDYGIL